ncbi:MAG: phosphotransferase [Halovenus sp.]
MATPPEQVERIVDAAVGCSVLDSERATGGRIAETHLLELDGEPRRAVCKIGGLSIRTGDVIEPLVVRLVDETTDIACPTVLASGRLRDGKGTYWALYEFCDGDPPTPFPSLELTERVQILEAVGSMLGTLHATHQFDRTGGLGRAGDSLELRPPNGLHVPERGRELLTVFGGETDWQPVLTHGDLFPDNLLVDSDGSVTAFLDWGNAHVTTAGYALARAELRFIDWFRFPRSDQNQLRRALARGYQQHRPLPPDFETHDDFYKLLWLGQSTDRHVRNAMSARGRRQIRRHLRSLRS